MNRQALNWAQSHDWYVGATDVGTYSGRYIVRVRGEVALGETEIIEFSSLEELKLWAGY